MRLHADAAAALTAGIVAEISGEDGADLVIFAERLPQDARARVRRADERRLASLLSRAGVRESNGRTADGALAPVVGCPMPGAPELCSAEFLSGAGWAWRVTAALARTRRTID